MELRTEVTEDDAQDVVDLLHESLLDACTTADGVLDLKGRKGGLSVAKQVKALVKALTARARDTGNATFRHMEIAEVACSSVWCW
jgi:DNA helicase MCM8